MRLLVLLLALCGALARHDHVCSRSRSEDVDREARRAAMVPRKAADPQQRWRRPIASAHVPDAPCDDSAGSARGSDGSRSNAAADGSGELLAAAARQRGTDNDTVDEADVIEGAFPGLAQVATAPIRILVDTRYIGSGDVSGRTCTPGASRYWIGDGPVGSPNRVCTTTVTSSCYASCTAEDELTAAKQAFLIDQVLPEVVLQLNTSLAVYPIDGNLVVDDGDRQQINECTSNYCGICGQVDIPSSFSSPGIESTDLVLLVTARPTAGSTIAFAYHCYRDEIGRPIVGYVNWGANHITLECDGSQAVCDEETLLADAVAVGVHEITHAMGFASSLMDEYITYETGEPYEALQQKTLEANGLTHVINELTGAATVAAVREHFQCAEMTGVALEDQGGSGTAGSHVEKTLFYDDYMTGTSSGQSLFTNISLAIMQDTGWYEANFTHSEPMDYGHALGCDFATKRCDEWTTENGFPPGYFCEFTQDFACSYDRSQKAFCSVRTWETSMEPWYRYFADGFKGGIEEVANFCPLHLTPVIQQIGTDQYWPGYCSEPDLQPTCDEPGDVDGSSFTASMCADRWSLGEQHARDARCFMTTAINESSVTLGEGESLVARSTAVPSCYRTRCISRNDLKIKIGRVWYDCPSDGGPVTDLIGFVGSVECPPAAQLCFSTSRRDRTWPELFDVSPRSGHGQGNYRVTLSGNNLRRVGLQIYLGETRCLEIEDESDGLGLQASCEVEAHEFNGEAEMLVPVIAIDSRGRSAHIDELFLFRDISPESAARLAASAACALVGLLALLAG